MSELKNVKVSQYSARAILEVRGWGVTGVDFFFFLPVLIVFSGFIRAIFSCLLTSEVKVLLGLFSFARPALYHTEMKHKACYVPT